MNSGITNDILIERRDFMAIPTMIIPPTTVPVAKAKPQIIAENKDVITFRGLNRLPKIEQGELRSMKNLCSDNPTCLSPRPSREVYQSLTSGTALFATSAGKICKVDSTDFYYDDVVKGTVTAGPKSMCEFGTYILIFPDKISYNYSTGAFATIGSGVYPTSGSCPDIRHVCVFNNRVWGIGGQGVYASKFKDPFNWTTFSSPILESDCVYFEIDTSYGELTGIIPLENHIVFTAKTTIFEIYGNKPSNFTPRLITNSNGCVDGNSLAEIDGRVYILDGRGVSSYGGSYPQPLSIPLQENSCVSGVGIAFNRKYYISLYNGTTYPLYVYDTLLGQWNQEDTDLHIYDFAVVNNKLYAITATKIYKFDSGTEVVTWEAETDRLSEQYLGMKAAGKIKVEAELESGSSLLVYIRTDSSDYRLVGTFATLGYNFFAAYELPRRAFWFQIKLVGTGPCKVYSVNREIIVDSDVK